MKLLKHIKRKLNYYRLILFRQYKATQYTGKGYKQGIGFDVEVDVTEILGFRFITDIRISPDTEWLEKLKTKLND